jgi:hypothetical protein
MRRRKLIYIPTLGIALAGLSATVASSTAVGAAPQSNTTVMTASYSPIPAARAYTAVQKDPSALAVNTATGATTSLTTGAIARPDAANTATPNGYTLVEQSKSTYIYMSKPFYMDVETCTNGKCVQRAEVYAQVKENVTGGDSKNWTLTQYASTVAAEDPTVTWHYTYVYYCGINVSGASDHICVNGASPSGSEVSMTPGAPVGKRFETINSGKDFPMVGVTVHWSTGGTYTGKFREWDTCNSKSSTLCATTGTGH